MIRLEQLVGQRRNRKGEVETLKKPVDRVFMDDKQVGWIDRRDSALFCPIVNLSPEELAPIVRGCQEVRDKDGMFQGEIQCNCQLPEPSKVREAMDLADDTDTDEDEDDDE